MRYTDYRTVCVVGGQSIEVQGFMLRRGVEVCVGTPGMVCNGLFCTILNAFIVLSK